MSRRPLVLGAIAAAAAAIGGWFGLGRAPEPLPSHPFWDGSGPRVIAHRGGNGLWPENTLHAFRAAAALGVDVLEMDLRQTADGEIVVVHDATVERTTDGVGRIDALTLAELQRLDAGHRWSRDGGRTFPYRGRGIVVPALREVFAALPQMRMNLEIKPAGPAMADPLCALIRGHGMQQRVAVVAADQATIDAFRSACPEVATAATRDEVLRFAVFEVLLPGHRGTPRAQVLQVPERTRWFRLVTPAFVTAARALNLKVEVWTVDEPDAMRRLLALPVDGIMTDHPDRLLALVGR